MFLLLFETELRKRLPNMGVDSPESGSKGRLPQWESAHLWVRPRPSGAPGGREAGRPGGRGAEFRRHRRHRRHRDVCDVCEIRPGPPGGRAAEGPGSQISQTSQTSQTSRCLQCLRNSQRCADSRFGSRDPLAIPPDSRLMFSDPDRLLVACGGWSGGACSMMKKTRNSVGGSVLNYV